MSNNLLSSGLLKMHGGNQQQALSNTMRNASAGYQSITKKLLQAFTKKLVASDTTSGKWNL
jgi:hypothetical protein